LCRAIITTIIAGQDITLRLSLYIRTSGDKRASACSMLLLPVD
jgi:hypothetical protein